LRPAPPRKKLRRALSDDIGSCIVLLPVRRKGKQARREHGLEVFSKRERAFTVILVLVAAYGIAKML